MWIKEDLGYKCNYYKISVQSNCGLIFVFVCNRTGTLELCAQKHYTLFCQMTQWCCKLKSYFHIHPEISEKLVFQTLV